MTEKDRCDLAISKGYKCDMLGNMFGANNNILKQNRHGYLFFRIYHNSKVYKITTHRFIWYYFNKSLPNKSEEIDHINRDKSDNTLINLRILTHANNLLNSSHQENAKGYYKTKYGYRVNLMVNRKRINLGYFDTEQEANIAYSDAKIKYNRK